MTDLKHAAVAREADWDTAPMLFEGGDDLQLTAEQCDLNYWFANVPHGTLRGNAVGHAPDVVAPEFLAEPGPLREALTKELAFRALAEERTARALSYLVFCAPDTVTLDFYASQLFDETRHAMAFRNHLHELGVAKEDLPAEVERLAGRDRESILVPLEEYVVPVVRDDLDFVGGVVLLTTLVEGVLAPAFEQSEVKWRPLDPAMADIERGAGIDEVRHLAVGSSLVREHVRAHPEETERLVDLVRKGMGLFTELPVPAQLAGWEALFQEGMGQHPDVIGDYEIWPGRRLLDTTPDERLTRTLEMTTKIHLNRLNEMGLGAALA